MYQKILVPLDGSALAECTLPHVKKIMAAAKTSDVILLRVDESDQVYIPKPYEKCFDFEALAKI